MISKKICLLGASGVGKTSLVRRFVHGIFSDSYLTTIGVKIDKKIIETEGGPLSVIVWDLSGEDEFNQVRMSYLRGAAGYLLVSDGTRPATYHKALELKARADEAAGDVPFVLVTNKSDLADEWRMSADDIDGLEEQGWMVRKASAKTGKGVEEMFSLLGTRLMAHRAEGKSAG